LGRLDEAVTSFHKALNIQPDYAEAHSNLGFVLQKLGKLDEAVTSFHKALNIQPDYAEAHSNLGIALQKLGKLDEAVTSHHKAIAIKPDLAEAHSNLQMTALYKNGMTVKFLKDMHAEWDESFGYPLRKEWRKHKNQRDMEKRLRIGFVSSDFGRHPVGYFLVRLLENKPQNEVEFICYSNRTPDDMTERLKNAADGWADTHGMANEILAERIRSDGIDILIDLSGHSAKNRLLVFARKPAPVQVSWGIGYPGTTGLKAIDCLLVDIHHAPKSEDHLYLEKTIRMPDSMFCYDPPDYAPSVGPLPAKHNGFITFGSFNNPAKLNDEVMAAWTKILEAAPGSRLLLKYRGIGNYRNRQRLLSPLETSGLDSSRLILEDQSPHQDLLSRYNEMDIALDTFPYSGGLTTCEALWMGVPVITVPGKTFAGRHSLSHLSTVGLSEFVARDVSHYVDLAVELAKDPSHMANLRSQLRDRMAKSPLCDGPRFARHFADEMRKVWHVWCENGVA
jgi:predicted O-linked N-acetylglucosamine transferase (SPINDLY family)